ncbi:hypothetical protein MBM_08309 [Drepanopeziza brunnea f. sp. 'multigermtubi' MB_m1]|uniref:Uncharacterized protein n=1 Tax=Marssonina brunnea f. sp. multigermtubi (strain MB_m1) TaxID=1072389 RepID=K1WL80_MARBU|nr:uncharacterized protein MBM_08309 [Drepanopeziza brunnea f. sp. 'multigermtubi' MB_m1]EKD13591.1 hypothetical protein MBM_08309 [Drepanopeziza brunnea f. sp. 'multigermtubi' MB_m1]
MDTTFTTQSATSTATNASIFNSSTFDSQNSSNMSDFSSYYYGLPGMPQLLARSSKIPRPATIVTDPDDSGFRGPTPMLHFVSKDRVIKQALGKGLRESIVAILMTKKPVTWTSVDYLRLGRNHIELESPAVVLITAEKDHTATAEAQRVVDVIKEECVKVGLPGLEVEMMEGIRSEGPAHRADDDNPGSRTQDLHADEVYKNHIVWKYGRSTYFTSGMTGAIASDYLWGDGITKSDEWHIKDAPSGSRFSLKGDSGALVWDIDGAVVGMMWGDCFQTLVTCVTPIEAVLADIKETLGARNFIMVVRNPTRK